MSRCFGHQKWNVQRKAVPGDQFSSIYDGCLMISWHAFVSCALRPIGIYIYLYVYMYITVSRLFWCPNTPPIMSPAASYIHRNTLRIIPKSYQTHAGISSNSCQNHAQIIPKTFPKNHQNIPIIIPFLGGCRPPDPPRPGGLPPPGPPATPRCTGSRRPHC